MGDFGIRRECEADEDLTKLVVDIKGADPGAAALLIECRGEDADSLKVTYLRLKVLLAFSDSRSQYAETNHA